MSLCFHWRNVSVPTWVTSGAGSNSLWQRLPPPQPCPSRAGSPWGSSCTWWSKDSSTEDSCQQPRMCVSYFGTTPSRDQNASFYELCSFDPGRQRRGITNTLGKHWDVSKAWMISSSAVSVQVRVAWAGCPRPSLSCSTVLFPCLLSAPEWLGELDPISTLISLRLSVLSLESRSAWSWRDARCKGAPVPCAVVSSLPEQDL